MSMILLVEGNIILYPPQKLRPQKEGILLPAPWFFRGELLHFRVAENDPKPAEDFVVHLSSLLNSTWVIEAPIYIMVKISGKQRNIWFSKPKELSYK